MSDLSPKRRKRLASTPIFEHLAEDYGRALLSPQTCGADPAVLSHMPWHVIQTKHNLEYLAHTCVTAAGFPVHLPLFVERTRRKPSRRGDPPLGTPVIRRLFPGFLFVAFELDDGEWPKLNTTRGVARLIKGPTGWPATMPRYEIEMLLRRIGPGGYQDDEADGRSELDETKRSWRNLTSLTDDQRNALLMDALKDRFGVGRAA